MTANSIFCDFWMCSIKYRPTTSQQIENLYSRANYRKIEVGLINEIMEFQQYDGRRSW